MLGSQIEQFAHCVATTRIEESVCVAFVTALLTGRADDKNVADELMTVARACDASSATGEAQLWLALLALEQCGWDSSDIAVFAVAEMLRWQLNVGHRSTSATLDARSIVVARLASRSWSAVRHLILPLFGAHEAADDVPPAEVMAVALVRHIVSSGGRHTELARDVLPLWLRIARQGGGKHLLSALHHFYRAADEVDFLDALLDVIVSSPIADGLPLLCRVASQSLGPTRWRVLLTGRNAQQRSLWQWLFECCEVSALGKGVALAYSKQAMYALREALGMLEALHEPLERLPWLQWQRGSTTADWDTLLVLYDVLDNKTLHLIEPVWTQQFEQLTARRQVPALWLRMVFRKALLHESVHVVRVVLVTLFQSDLSRDALWWLDAPFIFGPLLEALMRPVLYRGASGAVFPPLALRFLQHVAMRDELVAHLVPQLVPGNPALHYNVLALPALLQVVADTRAPCLASTLEAARVLLLARTFYRADLGWTVVSQCLASGAAGCTADEFLARLKPHLLELIFQHGPHVRALFSACRFNDGALPTHDAVHLACCVFGAAGTAEARRVLYSAVDVEAVLDVLQRHCEGGLAGCAALLYDDSVVPAGPALSEGPWAFAIRNPPDEEVAHAWRLHVAAPAVDVATWLPWMRALATMRRPSCDAMCEAAVRALLPVVMRWPIVALKWECIARAMQWPAVCAALVADVAACVRDQLADADATLELETLHWMLAASDAALVARLLDVAQLTAALERVFVEVVASAARESQVADHVRVMNQWARVALCSQMAGPYLARLLQLAATTDRFACAAMDALDTQLVPRWRAGDIRVDVDAQLVVQLGQVGFTRDVSATESAVDKSKRVFALARAYCVAWVAALPRDGPYTLPLCRRVVATLLQQAVDMGRALAKGPESERFAHRYESSPQSLRVTRMWQLICLAAMHLDSAPHTEVDAIAACATEVLHSVAHVLPSVGTYMEMFFVRFFHLHPRYLVSVMLSQMEDFERQLSAASRMHMSIAYGLLVGGYIGAADAALVERLLHVVVALLNSVPHPVRGRAMLICHALNKQNSPLLKLVNNGLRSAIQFAAQYFDACPELIHKVTSAEDGVLEAFLLRPPTMQMIYFDVPAKCVEIATESFLPDVMDAALAALQSRLPPVVHVEVVGIPRHEQVLEERVAQLQRDLAASDTAAAQSDFQRKVVPWHLLHLDDAADRELGLQSRQRLPMVVCASFLDRAPNIGGLTRTCEVFGLEAIVVADKRVMQSREYQSVAVTAEKWIRTEQVEVALVAEWLQSMRQRGYALVGLEQASNSVALQDFVFPRQCVLLLGNELKGLPAPFISQLDFIVEIPQLGTIRSLNVHVSASIMIAEYVMQWKRQQQQQQKVH